MAQELTIRETRQAREWTLDIVRDDVDGVTRGYIVTAHNGMRSITLYQASVSRALFRSSAVAFHYALRYLATAREGIVTTGNLPCYAPLDARYPA